MRPVILFSAMSLDGFIAGPQGEIDWLFQDADYGYAAFYDRIGTMLMGRKTFDFVNSLTPYPHADRENIVFSRSPKSSEADYLHFIQDDPVSFTKQLKTIPGKPIWLVGGGAINQLFVEAGLVDEMILSVHPVFLGHGIPLLPGLTSIHLFKTVHVEHFPSGLVQWHLTR
jgi:dihydrofolate reductase